MIFKRYVVLLIIALGTSASSAQQIFVDSFEDPTLTRAKAIEFLSRATFGPTEAEISDLTQLGLDGWIDNQMQLPASLHQPQLESILPQFVQDYIAQQGRQRVWWDRSINSPDQLRQRVAFALSEILVVSDQNSALFSEPIALTHYYDLLINNAFGNYRDLLEQVTLHPIMGTYLSMRGSTRDSYANIEPDENYAREIMQLFSIGLVELNTNGTIRLRGGQPIPTYDQSEIIGLAEAFTGWALAGADRGDGHCEPWEWTYQEGSWTEPMTPCPVTNPRNNQPLDYHVTSAKTIVGGQPLAAGQTAQQDMQQALDTLFDHPNVGPFLAQRLIQRLVTSNPTPAYVGRVARVFNNNGSGVRGDLAAMIRAILLDPEALAGATAQNSDFGKLREPLLRVTHLYRRYDAVLNVSCLNDSNCWGGATIAPQVFLGQAPLRSPSVFNFFKPDYSQPGPIADSELKSPEFQMATESQILTLSNFLFGSIVNYNYPEFPWQTAYQIRVESLLPLADNPAALVDRVSNDLLGRPAPVAVRDAIVTRITNLPNWIESPQRRVTETIFYIATSPQYLIQQ